MAGHKKLSGKQEEIRFKVSLCLCKYVSPKTGSLRNRLKAYAQVAQELGHRMWSCSWRTRIGKDRAIVRSIVILFF